ncbi:ANTAR domain-containing response regulator [Pontivivens ytuae]|uniref:ANTAR domain-containing protein n=1 Tax=Pontivivens ytuae TaxID=2789856 RepID=A0A7S9LW08_9RHOB|nr:ANTAR domain-containing protein [Pontivivens ytuae]QPH56188.1 ANTAR domain-containing protein [Pontivivens ytuae]
MDPERGEEIVSALREAGAGRVTRVEATAGLDRRLAEVAPDIVLVDLEHPSRDMLDALTLATEPTARPVAMFVDRSDRALMQAAIDAGVSAYVVDGLRADRVKPVLDMAIARFHSVGRLRAELEATRAALAERKTIDRAKGILMKARGLSEDEAYALLRKTAMDQGRRVAEVAESLVSAAGLLG